MASGTVVRSVRAHVALRVWGRALAIWIWVAKPPAAPTARARLANLWIQDENVAHGRQQRASGPRNRAATGAACRPGANKTGPRGSEEVRRQAHGGSPPSLPSSALARHPRRECTATEHVAHGQHVTLGLFARDQSRAHAAHSRLSADWADWLAPRAIELGSAPPLGARARTIARVGSVGRASCECDGVMGHKRKRSEIAMRSRFARSEAT